MGEHILGGSFGKDPLVQEDCAVAQAGQAGEVMGGHQHSPAFILQFAEELHNGGLAALVYACEWFIEEKELGVLGDSAGNEGALLLPAREFPDLPVAKL